MDGAGRNAHGFCVNLLKCGYQKVSVKNQDGCYGVDQDNGSKYNIFIGYTQDVSK